MSRNAVTSDIYALIKYGAEIGVAEPRPYLILPSAHLQVSIRMGRPAMALANCHECAHEVSTKAARCPACGAGNPSQSPAGRRAPRKARGPSRGRIFRRGIPRTPMLLANSGSPLVPPRYVSRHSGERWRVTRPGGRNYLSCRRGRPRRSWCGCQAEMLIQN